MKRNLLILFSLVVALIGGNEILKVVEKNVFLKTRFVFEMPKELPESIANKFGVPRSVETNDVYLVGVFNGYGLKNSGHYPGYKMYKVTKNKWEIKIHLPRGAYGYKFRFIPTNAKVTKGLEGEGFVWVWDPNAWLNIGDGFGGCNSRIKVYAFQEIPQKIRPFWKWTLACVIFIFIAGWMTSALFSLRMALRWKIFFLLSVEFLILFIFFLFLILKSLERSYRIFDTSVVNSILTLRRDVIKTGLSDAKKRTPLYTEYQEFQFMDGIEKPSENILKSVNLSGLALYDESGRILLHTHTDDFRNRFLKSEVQKRTAWEELRFVDINSVEDITYGFFMHKSTASNQKDLILIDPIATVAYGLAYKSSFVPLSKFSFLRQIIFTIRHVYELEKDWIWFRPFPYLWFIAPISIEQQKGYLLCEYNWYGVQRVDVLGETIVFYGFLFITLWIVIAFASLRVSRAIVSPIRDLADEMGKVSQGNLTASAKVTTKDEIQKLGDAFNDMVRGLRERELIKGAFGRYVSKQVAEKILKEPEKIHFVGERREVSIIFADIRNFTPYSETHTPEEVVQTLNDYFSKMIDIIFKYEGTLDKFIGDCVMAVFGAPLDQPDHAQRAVKCAWEMQDILNEFNKERATRNELPIKIGIGVNSGEAVSGNVGSEKRTEFSVVGDSVNLASRLEDLAKEGQILIGPQTYEKVKHLVEAKSLPPQSVKGKSEPVQLYEVISLKA